MLKWDMKWKFPTEPKHKRKRACIDYFPPEGFDK